MRGTYGQCKGQRGHDGDVDERCEHLVGSKEELQGSAHQSKVKEGENELLTGVQAKLSAYWAQ